MAREKTPELPDADIEKVTIRGKIASATVERVHRPDDSYLWRVTLDPEPLERTSSPVEIIETYPEAMGRAREVVAGLDKALGMIHRGRQAIQKIADGMNETPDPRLTKE